MQIAVLLAILVVAPVAQHTSAHRPSVAQSARLTLIVHLIWLAFVKNVKTHVQDLVVRTHCAQWLTTVPFVLVLRGILEMPFRTVMRSQNGYQKSL